MEEAGRKSLLFVLDNLAPSVRMKPGLKFEVILANLVSRDIMASENIAARLCCSTEKCFSKVLASRYPASGVQFRAGRAFLNNVRSHVEE